MKPLDLIKLTLHYTFNCNVLEDITLFIYTLGRTLTIMGIDSKLNIYPYTSQYIDNITADIIIVNKVGMCELHYGGNIITLYSNGIFRHIGRSMTLYRNNDRIAQTSNYSLVKPLTSMTDIR